MKHVELRFLFAKDLLKRERITLSKISGTENPADLGTEVLDVKTHCSIVCLGPAKQAVEVNVWKGLITLALGWAQRAQENSASMNLSRFTDLMLWCSLTRLVRPRGHA